MATYLDDFCDTIRSWLALSEQVYPDSVVASWLRMGEEYLSDRLRVAEMIQIDWNTVVDGRVLLPDDCLQIDTVRYYPAGKPLLWTPRNEFYLPSYDIADRYTIVGNYILFGTVDASVGTSYELSYFESIPHLTNDDTNWLYNKNYRLMTLATLWHAGMYAIEDQRLQLWHAAMEETITSLNDHYMSSRQAGSILVSKRRMGFG